MLKVFLGLGVTGLMVLAIMNGLLGVNLSFKSLLVRADLIGGQIPGVGITLAGACPGTTLAQWFVLLDGLVGAVFYGYFDAPITSFFAEKSDKVGFDQLLGSPFSPVALALAIILTGALILLERWRPWRSELGGDGDGVGQPTDDASDSAIVSASVQRS